MYNLEDYEDVQSRVERFKKLHPMGRIVTDVIQFDAEKGFVLVAAQVYREHEDTLPSGVDYAFGSRDTYNQNMRKFYVEDTVSSAIGRALALVLPDTNKKPTKQDMAKVERVENKANPPKAETISVENPTDPWTVVEKPMSPAASDAIALVRETLGASEVIPPADNCACGRPMVWYQGVSKAGKPWAHYRCSNVPHRRCQDPHWYSINSKGVWERRAVE